MLVSALLAAIGLGLGGVQAKGADGDDIVRGVRAQFSVAPNYPGCTDSGDADQLTDGVLGTKNLWVEPAAVGWYHVPEVDITFDLGEGVSVGAIELHSAGTTTVPWPKLLVAKGSDDGRDWRDLGELIADQEDDPKGYETRWYRISLGGLRMRFVRISVTTGGGSQLFFSDEVRVLRASGGQALALAQMPAQALGGPGGYRVAKGIRGRVMKQVADARAMDGVSSDALDSIAVDARKAVGNGSDRAAVLGESDLDVRVAKVRAKAWRKSGLSGVVAWKAHRFAFVSPADSPPSSKSNAALRIDALQGEARSDALLLTNTTDTPQSFTVRTSGVSGVKIALAPYVDTPNGVLASSALPWSDKGTVPAGTTSRLWVRADTAGIAPGKRTGSVEIAGSDWKTIVPLTVNVSSVRATKPGMSLTVSDYAVGDGAFDLKPSQVPAVLNLMRQARVDTVWARRSVLPWPSTPAADLDFGRFERWLADTSDFRNHFVFLNTPANFEGAAVGTPEFDEKVADWARKVRSHVPAALSGRVGFLTVDEPRSAEQARLSAAWGKALKVGAPDMTQFADPQWENAEDEAAQMVVRDADFVALHLGRIVGKGAARERYRRASSPGKAIWIYGTARGGKALDPTSYWRLMPWRAFAEGATGVSLWSVADDGRAESSWNEYTATAPVYTPLYLGDGVTDSVHWQALTEGMEDVELFARLKKATRGKATQGEADKLLAQVERLAQAANPDLLWPDAKSPQTADGLRLRAIALLERAAGNGQ